MKMVLCLLMLSLPWVVRGDLFINSDVLDYAASSYDGFPQQGCEVSLSAGLQVSYCSLPSGKATLTVNKAATSLTLSYEPESGPFACEDLQQTKAAIQNYTNTRGTNVRMSYLIIKNVVLSNDSLACTLAILGTDETETLILKDLIGQLRPSHLEGIRGVKYLSIMNIDTNVTSVPYDSMAQFPALRRATLSGGAFVLREGDTLLPHLEILELSRGKLKAIPKRAFVNTPALQMLLLFDNKIEYLDVDAFEGLSQLRNLSLNSNLLSALPAGGLRAAPRLQRVDLYDNRLLLLHEEVFRGLQDLATVVLFNNKVPLTLHNRTFANLPSLTELELRSNSLTTLPSDLLSNSTNLKKLTLQNNQLTSLPPLLLSGLRLKELDLSSNNLSILWEKQFADQNQLEILNLQKNHLEILPGAVFQDTTNLKVLNLKYNNISTLQKHIFNKLSHLQTLNLDWNRISDLMGVFEGPVKLEELSLSHNNIVISELTNTQLEGDPGWAYSASPLSSLSQLKRLQLAHNRVELVCADWRRLFYLEELDLSYNNISSVSARDSDFQSSATVDLSHNNIHTYDLRMYAMRDLPDLARPTFILSHNPFRCSCSLYPFLIKYKSRRNHIPSNIENMEETECASPPSLKGVKLTNVQLDSVTCAFPCSSACDSCLMRPNKSQVELTCNKIPRNFTDLPDPALSYSLKLSNVSTSNRLTLDLPPTVIFIDLSNLNLTAPPVATSVTVDLRNNRLSTIPVGLIESNCSLYLGNNPIQCVCGNRMDLMVFVKHNQSILDFQSVKCAGENRLVKDVDLISLCYYRDLTTLVVVLLAVLFGLALVCLFVYKKWSYIRFLLHKLGIWPFGPNELCVNDAFLSYANEEEQYVRSHVIPELEKPPGPLSLCVASRDWRLGDTITEQIQRSIDNSSIVIVLLSLAYLKSSWCQIEFRLAHKQGKARVVMMDGFDEKHKELMPEMKAYLKTNTYLKESDPHLFVKIREAVAKKQAKERRAREMLKSTGIDTQLNEDGNIFNNAQTPSSA